MLDVVAVVTTGLQDDTEYDGDEVDEVKLFRKVKEAGQDRPAGS